MLDYFLRRMALVVPTFIGITILIFAITRRSRIKNVHEFSEGGKCFLKFDFGCLGNCLCVCVL